MSNGASIGAIGGCFSAVSCGTVLQPATRSKIEAESTARLKEVLAIRPKLNVKKCLFLMYCAWGKCFIKNKFFLLFNRLIF